MFLGIVNEHGCNTETETWLVQNSYEVLDAIDNKVILFSITFKSRLANFSFKGLNFKERSKILGVFYSLRILFRWKRREKVLY